MATQGLFAKGAKLKRKNPSTAQYEDVPQANVLNSPDIAQDYVEISNHDSPGNFKEWIDTFRDGGDIPVGLIWNPALPMHVTIYNDLLAQTELDWRVVMNNATSTTWDFKARVSRFNVPLPHDQAVVAQMSLKVTANPALTP